jgi:hypothetical protein
MSPFCVSFGLAHVFITLGGPTDYRNYVHGTRVITPSHIETQQFWAPLEMNFLKIKKNWNYFSFFMLPDCLEDD